MKDDEARDCFEGFMLAKYTINDFEIDFQDDKVSFSIKYGLSDACLAYDGTIITLPLSEVKKNIKE